MLTNQLRKNKSCIVCQKKDLVRYLDLGKSAPANAYLSKLDLDKEEKKFPLRVYYCQNCHLAQLTDWVDRKNLFEYYAYFTGASDPLHGHFEKYANNIYKTFPVQAKKFVLDIGSNDGFLLKHFAKLGSRVLGVDSAKNVAKMANKNGIPTIPSFFNLEEARKIIKKYGKAGVITANNVLAHTDNIHGILAGVKELLDEDGIFVFEVQYLVDLIQKNEFDNTYHEHICYFLLHPLIKLLNKFGLQIFDVIKVDTQGGSIRAYSKHSSLSEYSLKKTVQEMLDKEEKDGFYNLKLYEKFGSVPQKHKTELLKMLSKLKNQNKKIIGYGAAAKGNTLLQYCNIGPRFLDYIIDSTPFKQGKFTPGTHIPVVPRDYMNSNLPDYILVLAWNYANDIIKNEANLQSKGVKFIVPIPEIKIF